MITENLPALKIHKLTQEQYDRELAAGNIDESALYLTPDEEEAPFKIDNTLIVRDGILGVNTTDVAEEDNTQPITSAGVHTVVGNIGAILDTI